MAENNTHGHYTPSYSVQNGNITHLPHIQNTSAGANRHDPMHSAIFEVYFTLPDALRGEFGADEETITEQVTEVTGLNSLNRTVQANTQKFFGVDVSYLNPTVDNTFVEFNITFNLNIRNHTDAWLFKIFRAWGKLGYDLADGTRTLMTDYVSESIRIAEANRNGEIWRSYIFHKVMLTNIDGLDSLSYTDNEARKLTCTFRADYWDDELA